MNSGRRLGLALVIVLAAIVVLDVAAPRVAQFGRVAPLAGAILVGAIVVYVAGTILAANGVRLRLPAFRRPRRLRSVRKGPPGSAEDFIEQFERRNRR